MNDLRFLVLAVVLGAATFFGVDWWINSGGARMPVFHQVPFVGAQAKPAPSASQGDADLARNALRHVVIDAANDLVKAPCDSGNKDRYVRAATAYAEAWLKLAPCVASSTCSNATSYQLDRAQTAFGTPLDGLVHDAMVAAHQTGEVHSSDFPVRTLSILAGLAADPSLMADSQGRSGPHVEVLHSHFRHVSRCG